MDENQFNEQAGAFVKVANEFPEIQVLWCPPFLKLWISSSIDWEIYASFSHAYHSPVIYFRCRTQYLTLDEISQYIILYKEHVSPSELPFTGEPYYFLHPCNTGSIIPNSSLSAWLSIVLKALGINLPIQLYANLQK